MLVSFFSILYYNPIHAANRKQRRNATGRLNAMTGTLINTGAIVLGGVAGMLFGKLLKDRHQETLTMACGVGTLFIGIAGAMNYMLHNDLFPRAGPCWP